MPQLHFYVSDSVAKKVHQRAQTAGLSTSKYLANIIKQNMGTGWPEQFFEEVVGGWQGKPLERPSQGQFESRELFTSIQNEDDNVPS